MSLQTRLSALITAIGADVKSMKTRLDVLDAKSPSVLVGNPETNLRIVRGVVDMSTAGATIVAGSGFTVARTALGVCTVTFSTAFPARPAVDLTVDTSTGAKFAVAATNNGSFVARIFNVSALNGAAEDRAFNFTAIGPA